MRAIVYDGEKTELVDGVELSDPGPLDVVVEIAAAGLCQSDLSYMNGEYPVPHPGVCGHEAAGVVAELGQSVTGLKSGDHVVIATLAACGRCVQCGDGRPTACRATLGRSRTPFSIEGEKLHAFAATSAFAERTIVGANQCVKIEIRPSLGHAVLVRESVDGSVGD